MTTLIRTCDAPDPAATDMLARRLSRQVRAGDVLLLDGPVGAGKTAFARALISALRHRNGLPPEEVPSPTFTLVQTYDVGAFDVWHADLYRLTGPDGVAELGLEEAFRDALCLIEWPDRLGPDAPDNAVRVSIAPDAADGRRFTFDGPSDRIARLCDMAGPEAAA